MPITVHACTSLENQDLARQIEQLYQTSHEFCSGEHALKQLKDALLLTTTLYIAKFNDQVVAVIWCTRHSRSFKLHYVVVDPLYRGRGVADRLVSEVCRFESLAVPSAEFIAGCPVIQRILTKIKPNVSI